MGTVWTVLGKEILETIRDRRTLAASVLIPIIMMPLLIGGFVHLMQRGAPTYRVALIGPAAAVETIRPALAAPGVREVAAGDGEDELIRGGLQALLVVGPTPAGSTLEVELLHTGAPDSLQAGRVLDALLTSWGREVAREQLAGLQLDPAVWEPVRVSRRQVETGRASHLASIFFPLIILLWTSVGAMYPAADVTCGEKERRSLDGLLVTPASRTQVLVGKFGAVFVVSALTLALATASTLVALEVGKVEALQVQLGQGGLWVSLALLLQAALTVAVISALEMLASAYARSFREAQSYLTPIFILLLVPGVLLSVAPDLAGSPVFQYVPLMNNVLSFRDLLLGTLDPWQLAVTVVTSVLTTAGILAVMVQMYAQEKTLTRA